jgi:carbonic anhydrase
MGEKLFGSTDQFNGVQFHFHAGSEHTVDGVRQDFEMHTVHLAKETLNEVGYAAVGIMFSVEDYTSNLSWAE